MARGSSDMMSLVIWGGLGYLFYEQGKQGKLDKLIPGLSDMLNGIKKTDTPKTDTPTTNGPDQTAGSPGSSGCDFIPGQRYVTAYGGGYIVVWNGSQYGGVTDKASAEQTYNNLCYYEQSGQGA